jgi:ABC transporter substrate binding protein
MLDMERREFIGLVGGGGLLLATKVMRARAQQPAMPVIGFLSSVSPEELTNFVAAFHEGLREAGYVEGRNVAIEYRFARGHNDRLPEFAADLVRRRVDVIATPGSPPGTVAAKAATTTIPIVFFLGGDPVASGFVAGLNRPGGNLTGVTTLGADLGPKRLHDLKLQPESEGPRLQILDKDIGIGTGWVDEDAKKSRHGDQLMQQLEMQVPTAILIRSSQPWPDCEQAGL